MLQPLARGADAELLVSIGDGSEEDESPAVRVTSAVDGRPTDWHHFE